MSMTVSDLKKVIEIDVPEIKIEELDDLTIRFINSSGEEVLVDDAGSLDIVDSDLGDDVIESYFVFIARGLGDTDLSYGKLKSVLDDSKDDAKVRLLRELHSIPSSQGMTTPIQSASLSIRILESVNQRGDKVKEGLLLLRDFVLSSSSSSSSL
jgi:hypothetical protein